MRARMTSFTLDSRSRYFMRAMPSRSYRPMSNLSDVSKLVPDRRFCRKLSRTTSVSANQSAYRHHHSTETAVAIMHNDLVCAVGRVSAFVMLDLSAAFDIVDHTVLLSVLEKPF